MCFPLSLSSFQIENSLYLANFLSELHKSLHVKAPAAEFIQSGKVFLPMRFCGACCEGKWVWIRQAALQGRKLDSCVPMHAACVMPSVWFPPAWSSLGTGKAQGKARSGRYEEGNKNGDELKMTSFPYIFHPKSHCKEKRAHSSPFHQSLPCSHTSSSVRDK